MGQVNGKPIQVYAFHLLDVFPCDKVQWNPLETSTPRVNGEYLSGAYYMSGIVDILYKPYS